jgi:hypothetical protein
MFLDSEDQLLKEENIHPSSSFYYCILDPVVMSAVIKIYVSRDMRAVMTSLLMYSALFMVPLMQSYNCGLPPWLWTQ